MTIEDVCLYILDSDDLFDYYLFELDSTLKKYSYVFSKQDIIKALQHLINKGLVKTIDSSDGTDSNITNLLDYDVDSIYGRGMIIFDVTEKGKEQAEKLESIEDRRQEYEKYTNIKELIEDLKKYNEIHMFSETDAFPTYTFKKNEDNVEIIFFHTWECEAILPIEAIGEFVIRDTKLKDMINKFTIGYKV